MIRYEINLVAFTRPTGGSFSGINERVICFDYIGREDIVIYIYIYIEREREREEDQIVRVCGFCQEKEMAELTRD